MITKAQIEDFYKQGTIAVIGVSRSKKKFGRTVYDELKKKGLSVLPVNSHTEDLDGDKCYKDITALPQDVKAAILITPKTETYEAVKQCLEKEIKNIWIQQGSQNKEALEFAHNNKANIIYGKCIMMFSEPVGVHKFHRSIVKLFGRLPK